MNIQNTLNQPLTYTLADGNSIRFTALEEKINVEEELLESAPIQNAIESGILVYRDNLNSNVEKGE